MSIESEDSDERKRKVQHTGTGGQVKLWQPGTMESCGWNHQLRIRGTRRWLVCQVSRQETSETEAAKRVGDQPEGRVEMVMRHDRTLCCLSPAVSVET